MLTTLAPGSSVLTRRELSENKPGCSVGLLRASVEDDDAYLFGVLLHGFIYLAWLSSVLRAYCPE